MTSIIYLIHRGIPVLFVDIPNKTLKTYVRKLEILKEEDDLYFEILKEQEHYVFVADNPWVNNRWPTNHKQYPDLDNPTNAISLNGVCPIQKYSEPILITFLENPYTYSSGFLKPFEYDSTKRNDYTVIFRASVFDTECDKIMREHNSRYDKTTCPFEAVVGHSSSRTLLDVMRGSNDKMRLIDYDETSFRAYSDQEKIVHIYLLHRVYPAIYKVLKRNMEMYLTKLKHLNDTSFKFRDVKEIVFRDGGESNDPVKDFNVDGPFLDSKPRNSFSEFYGDIPIFCEKDLDSFIAHPNVYYTGILYGSRDSQRDYTKIHKVSFLAKEDFDIHLENLRKNLILRILAMFLFIIFTKEDTMIGFICIYRRSKKF